MLLVNFARVVFFRADCNASPVLSILTSRDLHLEIASKVLVLSVLHFHLLLLTLDNNPSNATLPFPLPTASMKRGFPVLAAAALFLLSALPSSCSAWRIADRFRANAELGAHQTATPLAQQNRQPSRTSLHDALPLPSAPSSDPIEVLLLAKEWLAAAADPSKLFKLACTDEAVDSWMDRCDVVAASEPLKIQMATLLTICQHQRVSKASVPTECTDWLEGVSDVVACSE